jgi:Cdc6-like AAA superfamily ATPase
MHIITAQKIGESSISVFRRYRHKSPKLDENQTELVKICKDLHLVGIVCCADDSKGTYAQGHTIYVRFELDDDYNFVRFTEYGEVLENF